MVGAIGMNKDENDNPVTPRTSSIYEKPYWIQFYDATEEDKVTLGDIEPDAEICLWFSRVLDGKIIREDYNNVAERDTNTQNRYKKIEKRLTRFLTLIWFGVRYKSCSFASETGEQNFPFFYHLKYTTFVCNDFYNLISMAMTRREEFETIYEYLQGKLTNNPKYEFHAKERTGKDKELP